MGILPMRRPDVRRDPAPALEGCSAGETPAGRMGGTPMPRSEIDFQYFPYFIAASYMATTFSVGELDWRQCVGARQ